MERGDPQGEILIIEDDQGCSDLIAEVVGELGYTVVVRDRAKGSLAAVHETKPRLVILDVMLPDGDGFSILQALRADPDTAQVPVVLCTAALFELIGYQMPDDDPLTKVVAKPFHIDTLVDVLNTLIAAN